MIKLFRFGFICVIALSDWLPSLGYDYKNLVPPITVAGTGQHNHVTQTMTSSCGQHVRSGTVQMTPSLRLHRCTQSLGLEMIDNTVSVSVRPYVFGAGVIIRTTTITNCDSHCERVTVDVLDTADADLSRLAVVLLNNSLFLSTYFSVTDRRQVHHYIKPSSSPVQLRDVIAHSTTTSSSRDGVTLTLNKLSRHDVHVSVINDVSVLHVRHVTQSHVDLTAGDMTRQMTSR